jgi:hypothetical protein
LRARLVYAVATALLLMGLPASVIGKTLDKAQHQTASSKISTEQNKSSRANSGQRNSSSSVSQCNTTPSKLKQAAPGAQTQAKSAPHQSIVKLPNMREFDLLSREPFDLIYLENIKPLYTDPKMVGEGVWESATSPRDSRGLPIVYKTFYRPSVEFPNAIAYMMVIDMRKVEMRYYVGTQEPAAPAALSKIPDKMEPRIMAITNAMWQQRHSRGAGAIFRGKTLYPMKKGMATLIIYKDGSVDIQEWSSDIPVKMVQDARQLRHLIVKNGMVVQRVVKGKKIEDAEIGLGFLLGRGSKNIDGKRQWYAADRSAFGIRKDGNLVFAIGHHIGTKDLAKCLVLAGCQRAIHGDANPANIVGNLYLRDGSGQLLRRARLSPEQSKYSVVRYDKKYAKDFFGFFHRWPSYAPTYAGQRSDPKTRYKR